MKWINTETQLPEKSKDYLVYCKNQKLIMILPFSSRHHMFNAADDNSETQARRYGIDEVTHWMELPTPPITDVSENKLKKFSTAELVEELSKRDGVYKKTAEPYAEKNITVNGPAIVLVIED